MGVDTQFWLLITMSSSQSPSTTIDAVLKVYYSSLNINDYVDTNTNKGRFKQYLDDEDFEEDDITDELDVNTTAICDCILLGFDDNFPFDASLQFESNDDEKDAAIHYILQFCLHHQRPPSLSGILHRKFL